MSENFQAHSGPVRWRFFSKETGKSVLVKMQTWYAARSIAAIRLGEDPINLSGFLETN